MLQFVAPFKESIHLARILRPLGPATTPTHYVVLLQMTDQEAADAFFLQYDGRRFTSMEEARCHIVSVSSISFDCRAAAESEAAAGAADNGVGSGGEKSVVAAAGEVIKPPVVSVAADSVAAAAASASAGLAVPLRRNGTPTHQQDEEWEAAVGAYDAHTCVICMEHMDSHMLTTVCNHSFHFDCLMKWEDSPCPVCRFHHNSAGGESACQECQRTTELWVCLLCGFVGCGSGGRDTGLGSAPDHIKAHYQRTLHAYALEIETHQVWDFAGDGFVHRLLHNKADGKLVEVADPQQMSEQRPQIPGQLSDVQEERLVHSSLEGLARRYVALLTRRLEEQRSLYQKQIERLLEEQERDSASRKCATGAELISALRQERRQLEQRCMGVSERLRKARDENSFIRELNASLEADEAQWENQVLQAERGLHETETASREWVPKLQAKVAELMASLDGRANAAAGAAAAAAAAAAYNPSTGASSSSARIGGASVSPDGSLARAAPSTPLSAAAAARERAAADSERRSSGGQITDSGVEETKGEVATPTHSGGKRKPKKKR